MASACLHEDGTTQAAFSEEICLNAAFMAPIFCLAPDRQAWL
jgi:hypothetical protein